MSTFKGSAPGVAAVSVLAAGFMVFFARPGGLSLGAANLETAQLERAAADREQHVRVLERQIADTLAQAEREEQAAARIAAEPTDIRPDAIKARRQWAGFAAQRQLSPEKLSKLAGVLADGVDRTAQTAIQQEIRDLRASTGTTPATDPKRFEDVLARLRAAAAAAKSEYDDKLKAILGQEGYQAFQDYKPTTQASNLVDALVRPYLRVAGLDLTSEQAERFSRILAVNPPDTGDYAGYNSRVLLTLDYPPALLARLNEAAFSQAAAFLSSEQLKIIRDYAGVQRAYAELYYSGWKSYMDKMAAERAAEDAAVAAAKAAAPKAASPVTGSN